MEFRVFNNFSSYFSFPVRRISAALSQCKHVPASICAIALMVPLASQAASDATNPPDVLMRTPTRSIDVSTGYQHLTGGYSPWRQLTIHGVYESDRHVFQGELSHKREFDTTGNFLGLTDTYTINDDWFTSGSVGFGDGAFYLPRIRFDGFVYRKFLPKKNFVGSLGVGYYDAPDGHIDRSIAVGGAYYFEQPLVVEGGIRFNRSNPGGVNTHQQFVAASYSPDSQNALSARFAWGSEGYVPLAAKSSMVGFNSTDASVSWRHRFDKRWGFSISANRYRNPSYARSGVDVGVTRQFD
jgi:YaiO family outer membrane protein